MPKTNIIATKHKMIQNCKVNKLSWLQGSQPEPGGEDGPVAVPGPGRQPGRGSLQEGAAAPEAGHAAGGGPEALREAAEQALRQQRGQQGLTDRVASLSGHAE